MLYMLPAEFNRVLNLLVLIYLAFGLILYSLQRSMIYFPDKNVPVPAAYGLPQAQVTKVETEDGLTLSGWYIPPADEQKPVVVMFHGNAGNIGMRVFKAGSYLLQGYGFLFAEYRGYGGNPGKPSEQGFYADGRAWLKFLKGQGLPLEKTVLYGESIGTGVAVQMAVEAGEGLYAVILESPFTSISDIARKQYFFYPVDLMVKDRFDSKDKIADIKAPLLILHGDKDGMISQSHSQILFQKAAEPKELIIVPGAGHNDMHEHGATALGVDFLERLHKA